MSFPLLKKLDLQFFAADGAEFGGYDPDSAYEGISAPPVALEEGTVQPEGQGQVQP
jgi:hypothetical protein